MGRLEALKGLQTLLAAWDRTSDVDLLIAGAGSHEPALRRLAEGDPRIRFLGQLAPRDLGRYYVHARACVIPSLAPEVFPTVILEAFARKTPVIGRDIGGIPEILRESDGGLVYRTDRELVDAVRALATSEELRAQLGENGYRAFVARWVADAHLPRYVELLRSLARNKLGRVPWEDDPADTSTTGQAVG